MTKAWLARLVTLNLKFTVDALMAVADLDSIAINTKVNKLGTVPIFKWDYTI